MSDLRLFDFTGPKTMRIKTETSDFIDENFEILVGDSTPAQNILEFFERVIKHSVNSYKKRPSKKEDLEKITELEIQLKELQEQNDELADQIKAAEAYQNVILENQEQIKIKHTEEIKALSSLADSLKTKDNQILAVINPFQRELLTNYIKNEAMQKRINTAILKSDGLFVDITSDSQEQNIFNLLYDMLLFNAYGSRVRLYSSAQIEQAFLKFVKQKQDAAV